MGIEGGMSGGVDVGDRVDMGSGVDMGGGVSMSRGVNMNGVDMMAAGIDAYIGTKDEKCGVGLRRLSH